LLKFCDTMILQITWKWWRPTHAQFAIAGSTDEYQIKGNWIGDRQIFRNGNKIGSIHHRRGSELQLQLTDNAGDPFTVTIKTTNLQQQHFKGYWNNKTLLFSMNSDSKLV